MTNIGTWGDDSGELNLYKTDENMLRVVKIRNGTTCSVCDRKISPKSYCLGGGYHKICLNCYEKFLNNFIKSLDGYKEKAKALIESIKSKENKLTKNNILAKVEDNGKD